MTQPNQSELFRLASLIGCEPESEERHIGGKQKIAAQLVSQILEEAK